MKFERYYFYYVDFDGHLYHENSLLTDKKFLNFFFKHIQYNKTGYFENYPYISPCGKEMNFIACPDTPIVFRNIENQFLIYAGDLKISFDPNNLKYVEVSGQLYYPVNHILYGRIGKYVLNELSNNIIEKDGKYFFNDIEIPTFSSFRDLIGI
ncbi:MAG: hypothetical protein KatS3mg129_2875 [Leptospiraceae bacterium]|nr:MAG: hypothetical protein KatS3mg129_2875 [Leptospiraceae bacterium]